MHHAELPSLEALWEADPAQPSTSSPATFDLDRITHLPLPVQRLLTHAIEPGAPLYRAIRLHMRGEIKLGAWRPFEATLTRSATELTAPRGTRAPPGSGP